MQTLTSLRDTLVVARFHLMRAVRSRSVVVLAFALAVVHMGGAWVFVEILKEIENATAATLGVPATDRPGAMLEVLREREDFRRVVGGIVPRPELLDWALSLPYLTVGHVPIALGVLPFFATLVGAEVVSGDIKNRALRYEVVRTGRLEIVGGRLLGQALLIVLAVLAADVGTWLIAMTLMVEQPPVAQMASLLAFAPRLCAWALPFLGIGVAASMVTGNTNLARGLALGATGGSFVAWGMLNSHLVRDWGDVVVLLQRLLPQSQMTALWDSGLGWAAPSAVLVVFGGVLALSTYPLFARRNL